MLGSLCFAFFSFFFLAWGARGKLSGAAGLRIFRLSVVIGLFLRPTISTAARKIGVAGGRRGGWNQRGKTAGVDLAGVEIYSAWLVTGGAETQLQHGRGVRFFSGLALSPGAK